MANTMIFDQDSPLRKSTEPTIPELLQRLDEWVNVVDLRHFPDEYRDYKAIRAILEKEQVARNAGDLLDSLRVADPEGWKRAEYEADCAARGIPATYEDEE